MFMLERKSRTDLFGKSSLSTAAKQRIKYDVNRFDTLVDFRDPEDVIVFRNTLKDGGKIDQLIDFLANYRNESAIDNFCNNKLHIDAVDQHIHHKWICKTNKL